jgi:hypothetical protein
VEATLSLALVLVRGYPGKAALLRLARRCSEMEHPQDCHAVRPEVSFIIFGQLPLSVETAMVSSNRVVGLVDIGREWREMGLLRVLCGRGDAKIEWDTEKEDAVKEAERIFHENVARGYASFRVDTGVDTATRIDQFERDATEIVQIPRIVGG